MMMMILRVSKRQTSEVEWKAQTNGPKTSKSENKNEENRCRFLWMLVPAHHIKENGRTVLYSTCTHSSLAEQQQKSWHRSIVNATKKFRWEHAKLLPSYLINIRLTLNGTREDNHFFGRTKMKNTSVVLRGVLKWQITVHQAEPKADDRPRTSIDMTWVRLTSKWERQREWTRTPRPLFWGKDSLISSWPRCHSKHTVRTSSILSQHYS